MVVALGLIVVAILAASPISSALARGNVASPATMATPGGGAASHCLSVMVQNIAPLNPEMQRRVDALSATIGKPVSVERVGQHLCFATEEELQTYQAQHGIEGTTIP